MNQRTKNYRLFWVLMPALFIFGGCKKDSEEFSDSGPSRVVLIKEYYQGDPVYDWSMVYDEGLIQSSSGPMHWTGPNSGFSDRTYTYSGDTIFKLVSESNTTSSAIQKYVWQNENKVLESRHNLLDSEPTGDATVVEFQYTEDGLLEESNEFTYFNGVENDFVTKTTYSHANGRIVGENHFTIENGVEEQHAYSIYTYSDNLIVDIKRYSSVVENYLMFSYIYSYSAGRLNKIERFIGDSDEPATSWTFDFDSLGRLMRRKQFNNGLEVYMAEYTYEEGTGNFHLEAINPQDYARQIPNPY